MLSASRRRCSSNFQAVDVSLGGVLDVALARLLTPYPTFGGFTGSRPGE